MGRYRKHIAGSEAVSEYMQVLFYPPPGMREEFLFQFHLFNIEIWYDA